MRVLELQQMEFVAGGVPTIGEAMTLAGGVGGGIGSSVVISAGGGTLAGVGASLGSTAAITVGTAGAAGLVATGIAASYAGAAIYDALPASAQNYIGGRIVAPIVDRASSIGSGIWAGITGLFGGFYGNSDGGLDKDPPVPHKTR
jgi:hypothetical protein